MLDLILSDAFCARSVLYNLENPPAIIRAAYDDEDDDSLDDSLDGSLDGSLDLDPDIDPPCSECDDTCWIEGECDCPCHDNDDDDSDDEDFDE